MELFRIKTPFILSIFGASGDLAKLKIFPAIYKLAEQKRLPEEFYIVGFARSKRTVSIFRKEFTDSIFAKHPDADKKLVKTLADKSYYFAGQYDNLQDFKNFRDYLKKLTNRETITQIAYFSVPPVVFKDIIQNLGESRNQAKKEDLRLVIEKPFGQDTESARALFHFVARYFNEEAVYLLDHYLGKTVVQSILHLRHSNSLLNLVMKGPSIANIQITASERIGVEDRIGYFNQVGTLKDMVQSHLLQVLALITMSIPITENPDSLHREKYSILSALNFTATKKNIALGQYESYRKTKEVPKNSTTETFAAIRLFIDRESWYSVPIYIRTGKKLKKKHTYIVVELKKFQFQPKSDEPNRLIFELQPDEKISIRLVNRIMDHKTQTIQTSESIACTGDSCLPEHALLLLDVIRKNRMHFLYFPEIIATWQLTDRMRHFIKTNNIPVETYPDYSPGPKSQYTVTEIDGFKWYEPEQN